MNPFKSIERKIEMSLIEKWIAAFIERSCKNYITTIIGLIGMILYAANTFLSVIPAQYHDWVTMGASVLTGVALILAKDSDTPPPNLPVVGKVGLFLLAALLLPVAVHGQSVSSSEVAAAMTPSTPIQNLYAAGASYSINASPSVAGTALYAHALNGSGTYAFTAVDALPATIKPFSVTSNIGVGVAQQVFTLGKVPVYMPTAAGISWSGSNTGWQWNGGVLIGLHVRGSYYLMPSVRFLKSSVSGGTGYQPIIGLLFGWGK